jgi:hypothetical protein
LRLWLLRCGKWRATRAEKQGGDEQEISRKVEPRAHLILLNSSVILA